MGRHNGATTLEDSFLRSQTCSDYDSTVALPGICAKKLKTCVHTKTWPRVFAAALFIIANIGKQPGRPSVGELRNKLWSVQTMEYYSVPKRREPSNHAKTWRGEKPPKCTSLSLHTARLQHCDTLEEVKPWSTRFYHGGKTRTSGCQGSVGREEWRERASAQR